jgi:hypothetical protein
MGILKTGEIKEITGKDCLEYGDKNIKCQSGSHH